MTFADPGTARGLTPAERLSDELERVTDEFAEACDREAVAENAYLRAYAVAFTTSEVAATIRPKTAECAAVKERCEWNLAKAAKESSRRKVEEVQHRLMAALSHQRFIREQT